MTGKHESLTRWTLARWDWGRSLLLGTVLLLAGGCAAQRAGAPAMSREPPASPEAAREELAQLEQHIARSREMLGLPGTPGQAPAVGPSRGAIDAAPQAAPPPAAPAPAERAEAMDDAPWEPPDPCRHTRAICRAAQRICQIAEYLADEDARSRCERARSDCEQARHTTGCD